MSEYVEWGAVNVMCECMEDERREREREREVNY